MSLTSDQEFDRQRRLAIDEWSQAQDTIMHNMQHGGILTYQGQIVTAQQAADIAFHNYKAHHARACSRHRRDKLESLRADDERSSGLLTQLWAMIRARMNWRTDIDLAYCRNHLALPRLNDKRERRLCCDFQRIIDAHDGALWRQLLRSLQNLVNRKGNQ